MASEARGAGAAQEALQFSDAAGCRAWLDALARADIGQRHALLSSQAQQIPEGPLAPAVKLEALELMREAVAAAQAERAGNCRGRPVPLSPGDREVWQSVVGLWQAMASAYESLIADMAGAAPELATQAALICQRALRYTGLAMGDYNRAYHSVAGGLWQQLHRLYVFAENAVVATTRVYDAVGRLEPATSCAASYVRTLLAQLAQPDALSVRQMEVVDQWLERWEGLVSLSPNPLQQSAIPALAVDLTSPKGAGFAQDMPAAGVRHLALENLGRTLRHATASLRQGQTPAQLGLGEIPREECETLLVLLYVQWCAAGTGRVDERTPARMNATICPGIASIHYHLTGQPDREPAARDPGKAGMAESAVASETWTIVNKSASGFLGLCRRRDIRSSVSHRQLLGLQAGPGRNMYVGIVQRLAVDEQGAIWAGLRLFSAAPQAAVVRAADTAAGECGAALLLPEDAARKVPASLLLPPGCYRADRVLDMRAGTERKIRLRTLLDHGPNFERATFAPA